MTVSECLVCPKKSNHKPSLFNMEGGKTIEEKLLDQYGGGGNLLPQSLMFDHVSPATRLLEKRRQMFEVQEALNSQKEEFGRREDAFRRREDGLRRKDLDLQESLIKFNKFLQENESKRNRALKRAAEEKKQRELKELEIRRLEVQLRSKLQEGKALKEELENNLKYQDYLENVVQNMSKFFPEISDTLNRYKTLKNENKYLLEKQQSEESFQENLQREFALFRKAKENQILNQNNEIAELQVRLEHALNKTMRIQSDIDEVTQETSEKALALGQILSSVSNTLERCEENFRRRHNKPIAERSTDKMSGMSLAEQCLRTQSKLDEIAMFMIDFKDIKDEYVTESGGGNGVLGANSKQPRMNGTMNTVQSMGDLSATTANTNNNGNNHNNNNKQTSGDGIARSKSDSKSIVD